MDEFGKIVWKALSFLCACFLFVFGISLLHAGLVANGVKMVGTVSPFVFGQSSANIPYSKTIGDPTASLDGILVFGPWETSFTIDRLYCIVDPGDTGESVTLSIYEADTSGDESSTIATLVCDNNGYTACASGCDTTITDNAIAAEAPIGFNTTTVSGTVSQVMLTIRGQ